MDKLGDIWLESEFKYCEFFDGEDEPGIYFFRNELSKKYPRLLGWKEKERSFQIEINQTKIGEIKANGLLNRGCSAADKFVLDHFLSMM